MDQFLPGIELDTDEQLAIFDDIIAAPPQRFQVNPVPPTPAPRNALTAHNNNNNNNNEPQAPAPNAAPEGPGPFFQTVWRGQSAFFYNFIIPLFKSAFR